MIGLFGSSCTPCVQLSTNVQTLQLSSGVPIIVCTTIHWCAYHCVYKYPWCAYHCVHTCNTSCVGGECIILSSTHPPYLQEAKSRRKWKSNQSGNHGDQILQVHFFRQCCLILIVKNDKRFFLNQQGSTNDLVYKYKS